MMDNRELDRAIAEKFLGWTDIVEDAYTPSGRNLCGTHPSKKGGFNNNGRFIIPYYTEQPLAAIMLVLDEIERRDWHWVWRTALDGYVFKIIKPDKSVDAFSRNRYRAVCEAVMGAIEGE
jgi:hypothetical protein